jgi:hypothetical protein
MNQKNKKQKPIKFLYFTVILLILSFMTGCGASTPEGVMTKATTKSLKPEAKNYRSTLSMDMEIQIPSQTINANMTAKTEQSSPDNIHLNMDMNMDVLGKSSAEAYVIKDGERYLVYMNTGDKWEKEYMDFDKMQSTLNNYGLSQRGLFTDYARGLENATMTEESLDGKDCYKIVAQMPASNASTEMEEMLKNIGVDNNYDISQFGNINVTYWIEKKTFYPSKIEFEMTELMKNVLEQAMKGSAAEGKMSYRKAIMTMTFSDYGQIGEIKPSEEASKALLK